MIDLWHLRRIHWLRDLPPVAVKRLERLARRLEFRPGDLIFRPTSRPRYVFLLERGLVRIYRVSPGEDEVTFGYVREGEVFGELAVYSPRPRESFARALRPSVVWRVPKGVFRDVMESSPSICFEVGAQVEGRFKRIESRVEDLVFRDVRARVARILDELAAQFGSRAKGRVVVTLPLTQADMAVLVGATRQSVGEALRELEADDVIARGRRRVVICDANALKAIAAGQPGGFRRGKRAGSRRRTRSPPRRSPS